MPEKTKFFRTHLGLDRSTASIPRKRLIFKGHATCAVVMHYVLGLINPAGRDEFFTAAIEHKMGLENKWSCLRVLYEKMEDPAKVDREEYFAWLIKAWNHYATKSDRLASRVTYAKSREQYPQIFGLEYATSGIPCDRRIPRSEA